MIMKSEKRKQFIVGLLVGIIIMILLVSVLVVTDVIRFTNKIDNENLKLTSHGVQAHSAHPDLGINAI